MLDEAIKYEKQLNTMLIDHFIRKENQWYYGGINHRERMKITDKKIQFVSKNKDGSFNGLISARKTNNELTTLVLISFNNNNPQLMRDIIEFFYWAYTKAGIMDISWGVYQDAPFFPQAKRAAEKFGKPTISEGKKYTLVDGRLHTLMYFHLAAVTIDFEKAEKFLRIGKEDTSEK